jgi:hypothetical protein
MAKKTKPKKKITTAKKTPLKNIRHKNGSKGRGTPSLSYATRRKRNM